MHLAELALKDGDRARATALHIDCLRIRQGVRDLPGTASSMEKLAWVLVPEAGEHAARLLGAAEALRESIHAPMPPAARADYEQRSGALAVQLGEGRFEAARLQGRSMGPQELIAALSA
jgi:hypothetical protein